MADHTELIAEARAVAGRDRVPGQTRAEARADQLLVALADALEAQSSTVRSDDDRAPADTVTAPFQTIMDVYIDGMGTGIATALGSLRPDAPNAVIDQATQGLVGRTLADPIAVEQLAEKVRQRLRGEEDEQIDEVRVYGGGDRG